MRGRRCSFARASLVGQISVTRPTNTALESEGVAAELHIGVEKQKQPKADPLSTAYKEITAIQRLVGMTYFDSN